MPVYYIVYLRSSAKGDAFSGPLSASADDIYTSIRLDRSRREIEIGRAVFGAAFASQVTENQSLPDA
jgi:hypothetical protein